MSLRHLQAVQVLQPADHVALQVQDLERAARVAQQLYALDALLVQRHLLQAGQHAIVVFRPLRMRAGRKASALWQQDRRRFAVLQAVLIVAPCEPCPP